MYAKATIDYANLLKFHCTKKREHYIPVVGLGMDKVNPNDIKKGIRVDAFLHIVLLLSRHVNTYSY